jgi:predicted DNA-binding protein (UPF0278 family)
LKSFKEIQDETIKNYNITIVEKSTCRSRTHAHIKQRKVCKWKQASSIQSTFTLFHEIGHIMTKKSWMRRCESEYAATVWALDECKKYNLTVPYEIIRDYQNYIYNELDRGLRRGGMGLPSREYLKLDCSGVQVKRRLI